MRILDPSITSIIIFQVILLTAMENLRNTTVPVDKTLDKDKVLDKRNLEKVPGFTDARCWVFLILFVYYIS